jgi:hypothetical protein
MSPVARQLNDAMAGENPFRSLRNAVIRRLSVDGMSREKVMGDLEDLRQAIVEAERYDDEELVLTIMDHLVGWCSPRLSLANVGFSEYDDYDDIDIA